MPIYSPPLRDIRFILNEVLDADATLATLPAYAETGDADLREQILEEVGKLAADVLFPLNGSGDRQGCTRHEDGSVTTPDGFVEAYNQFAAGGWCGVSGDPDYGGMGLPQIVNFAVMEMLCASNMAFGMYPGLSHGAYDAIHIHGSDAQKQLYLPKLLSGVWSGTMNLTEPHAGTDLGLIRTKAVPHADGGDAWAITGQKIFISAGEHDLTENIVHLVLARLPDAPEGVKGISLFVVPKFLPQAQGDDWVCGARNTLTCAGIEHKMGIKASATCVMQYDGAKGWLVGEAHKGLKAMFTMMNAARLGVAMQGLGIADVAYQNAVAYAKDRLQMRALDGAKFPEKIADPIIVHPDVRRMLLTGKAFVEGARALSYWCGLMLDVAEKHPDANTRQEADDFVALLTPVLKAYQTDMGYEVASLAIQVLGGAGYITEYGVEQYARDAKIAKIYEGTNGIQALDLVGRKMTIGYGRLLRRFFHPVAAFIDVHMDDGDMAPYVLPLAKAFGKLQQATGLIAQKGLKNPVEAGAASSDYLRQFALVALAFIWARMAKTALTALAEGTGESAFYEAKLQTAAFFFDRMLPETEFRFRALSSGAGNLMSLPESAF
ncbi:MAG: acyl-CoA dehydrogenase C-terminal domain-containing protein [Pseudomonadota bacterium]